MLLLNLINSPLQFIAFVIALFIGICIHEFAHAFVADRSGDPTARLSGRLTLNPLAHLDPIGTLMLFVVGFGWGKPVPINPNHFRQRNDELKVAIAGIIANLMLAVLIGIPIRVALLNGHSIDSSAFLSFLNIIVEINVFLAAFNLLPIFPLDGSHFVEYFLEGEAKHNYQYYGPYLLIALVIFGQLTGNSLIFRIIEPLVRFFMWIARGINIGGLFG